LLKDDYGTGEDRVPGLASIPILGNLFRSENRTRTKSNLLVFLRPVVMRTQAQADSLTIDRYESIRAQMQGNQPAPSMVLPIKDSPVLPELKRGATPQPNQAIGQQPGEGAPAGQPGKPATPGTPAPASDEGWGRPVSPRPGR
jgi:general secretion pathway protein D